MPTYDYKCEKCNHRWELFQSITSDPIKKCPECKSQKAKRVIGPGAGILFKGSGFYQTDYRSDSYKQAAATDKKSQESASTSSETKSSESKSDAKPAGPAKSE